MEREEEYELIPVTPIRRLEKEIEKLKTLKGERKEGYPVTKILKANHELITTISSMVKQLGETNRLFNELLSMLKTAGEVVKEETEAKPEADKRFNQLQSRFEDLLDQNRAILDRLDRLEERLESMRRITREESKPKYRGIRF